MTSIGFSGVHQSDCFDTRENLLHLIMFDIDGTLVDSCDFDNRCFIKTAETVLGIPLSANWEDYVSATDAGILDEAIDRHKIPGEKSQIYKDFRKVFINLVSDQIERHSGSIREIPGARQFMNLLINRNDVRVAIATGGWEETAMLKLQAAGINIEGVAFASSSDHSVRTEIMKIAESRISGDFEFESRTYFGDALWDKEATRILGYRFILVGSRIQYNPRIENYLDNSHLLSLLNLH